MTARPPAPTVFEDPGLPHQIRFGFTEPGTQLFVSCNCMRGADGRYKPLADPSDVSEHGQRIGVYRKHLEEVYRS